ncbi:MAG: endonuclease [Chloroflexi bacterium]|nr:endonuclease [Chloroflexota bacterium]
MTQVLVLNASLEKLHHVSLGRAVALLLAKKAELVRATGRRLRGATIELEEPAVIRLCRFIFVPFHAERLTRRAILERDGCCQYCGTTDGPLTVDHVMPRSRGGATTWENCVAACRRCNHRKDSRTPAEARMKLLYGAPQAPKARRTDYFGSPAIAAG